MFKHDVTYTNFRGEKTTETLRFNLSETELLDATKIDNVFSADYLTWIVEQQNVSEMFDVVRKLIAISYGVMSEDGKYFRKKPDDIYDFLHSAAYEAFLEELIGENSEQLLTDFVINVFPAKFSETVKKSIESNRKVFDVAR